MEVHISKNNLKNILIRVYSIKLSQNHDELNDKENLMNRIK